MSDESAPAPLADYAEPLRSLPDGVWTFRRVYAFGVTIAALLLIWRAIELMPPEHIGMLARWLVLLLMLIAVLYNVGPTAEHIVRLTKAAWVMVERMLPWKKGAG